MKKIAWIKYTSTLDVGDGLLYTTGSTDLRTELFRCLIKNGVEIVAHSTFSKGTKEFLETDKGKEDFHLLSQNISTDIDEDVDFIVVEQGADNARFTIKTPEGEIPQISYCNKILKKYKGLVFYLQIDIILPFTFFPEYLSLEYTNKYLGFGNFIDLVKDKNFVILTPTEKYDQFVELQAKCARNRYKDLFYNKVIKVDTFEPHYCGIYGWDEFKIKKNPEYKISYVGGDRARMNKFNKYYFSLVDQIPVEIWGKWDEDKCKRFPDVTWKGVLGHGLTRKVYNESTASIIIGDVKYEKLDIVSGRFFEVVTAKTLPLIDYDLRDTTVSEIFDDYLMKELVIKDKTSIMKVVNKYANSDARVDIIRECISQMKKFSPQNSVDQLILLFDKHKDFKLGKKHLDNAVICYDNILKEREEVINYSKDAYNESVKMIYAVNSVSGEPYSDEKNLEDYTLKNDNLDWQSIEYRKDTRCVCCGEKLPDKTNKNVSLTNCPLCKENPEDSVGIAKRKKKNLESYIETITI